MKNMKAYKNKLPKISIGAVYSISLTHGIGFIQYVKRGSRTRCETIRVLPGSYCKIKEIDISNIVKQKELFFTQIPLQHAIHKKLITFIGNHSIPKGSDAPRYYRDKEFLGNNFAGWQIVDDKTLKQRVVKELSNKELSLSPYGTTSFPDLVECIENGWTPEVWNEADSIIGVVNPQDPQNNIPDKVKKDVKNNYISILKIEDIISLSFDIENDEILTIGEKINEINESAYMNGYNWEAFFNYYLPKYAPDVFEGMDSDPEAGTYVAMFDNTPENELKAERFVSIIHELIENEEELYRIVREEGMNIVWD